MSGNPIHTPFVGDITAIERALEAVRLAYEESHDAAADTKKNDNDKEFELGDSKPDRINSRRYSGRRKTRMMENSRLAACKQVTPPSIEDWQPVELPPTRLVPYEMAPLFKQQPFWIDKSSRHHHNTVSKRIKADLKRRHVPVLLVREMEEQVRQFALDGEETMHGVVDDFVIVAPSDIVKITPSLERPAAEGFVKWVCHSLARLYGLTSESEPPDSIVLSRPASHLVSKVPSVPLWLQLNN